MRTRIDVVARVAGRQVAITFYPDMPNGEVCTQEHVSERVAIVFRRAVPFTFNHVPVEDSNL